MAPETEDEGEAVEPLDSPLSPLAPAEARRQPTRTAPTPAVQQVSPLSLGIGMALMGIGIGFLGVRMRRR